MKKIYTLTVVLCLLLMQTQLQAQLTPELLYYRFDGTGTSVPNLASAPPVGTATATIQGGITQGGTGLCGGALVGSGLSSTTDFLNTGYTTNLTGTSWTISFYTSDFGASTTLFYIFGDASAGSFRCFTNGVAGPNNWILRGGFTDVLLTGGATTAPHVCTFVYDMTAGNIKAYLDGVLNNTVTQTGPTIAGAGPLKVMGYSANVGAPANGKMDEFRLYNRALTAAEVLQLNVPAQFTTIAPSVCAFSYTSPAGNTYTSSGTYSDTLTSASGCDSIITINLTLNQPSQSVIAPVVCNSYTAPSGAVYTTNGTYLDTIANAIGCDSIITINLTVNSPSSAILSPSVCYTYTSPGGQTITSSGMYMDTLTNASGCDSVITLFVTILEPSFAVIAPVVCNSYTSPSGALYTSNATFLDTIPNAAGCDSLITVNLTVLQSSTSTLVASACVSFLSPAGNQYTASGNYIDTLTSASGCDSLITIFLTIYPATSSTLTITACDSYTAPSGSVYTTSGTYTDIITNSTFCDSVITINLTINTVNTSTTTSGNTITASAGNASYQWVDCNANFTPISGATAQAFTATANGNYAVIITQNNCIDTSACVQITGIGIAETDFASRINLYPNPNQGNFVIDLGAAHTGVTIIITDITGRTVFAQTAQNGQRFPIALNAAAGIYTVQISTGTAIAALRIVKD